MNSFEIDRLNLWYGSHQALRDEKQKKNAPVHSPRVRGIAWRSSPPRAAYPRRVLFYGKDIYAPKVDVTTLRSQVGMVFQKANPFPMSIYDNVAYGPRIHGIRNREALDALVEESLKDAALWDEVKDRLKKSALGLSGGQQQRLCIARALAVKPEVLLLDESTSALDPMSTGQIEELVGELKQDYTVIMVTHNMQQAVRVSDCAAFFLLGDLVEFSPTDALFNNPKDQRTADYVSGRFG